MSTFWMIYLGTFGFTILLTTLTILLFELPHGEKIHTSYALMVNVMGAIPFINFLIVVILVIAICIGLVNGDLIPKEN